MRRVAKQAGAGCAFGCFSVQTLPKTQSDSAKVQIAKTTSKSLYTNAPTCLLFWTAPQAGFSRITLACVIALACVTALACVIAAACLVGCSPAASTKTAVRASVDDYSWAELAAISEELAEASDEAAALGIARDYNLVGEDGKLDGSQAKRIELCDGTVTRAVIVGFDQDTCVDGAPAGITFMLENAVGLRAMNGDAGFSDLSDETTMDTMGGWATCELRRWLNGDFADCLPADLRAVVVETEKVSTAVPQSSLLVTDGGMLETAVSSVTERTVDRYWVASLSEITGVSDDSHAATYEVAGWRDVLRAEGGQYKLFAYAGVAEEKQNALLVRHLSSSNGEDAPCSWWLRSIEDGFAYTVSDDGRIDRLENVSSPAEPHGVIVFFCA